VKAALFFKLSVPLINLINQGSHRMSAVVLFLVLFCPVATVLRIDVATKMEICFNRHEQIYNNLITIAIKTLNSLLIYRKCSIV